MLNRSAIRPPLLKVYDQFRGEDSGLLPIDGFQLLSYLPMQALASGRRHTVVYHLLIERMNEPVRLRHRSVRPSARPEDFEQLTRDAKDEKATATARELRGE